MFQNHVSVLAVSGPGAELSRTALSADCFFQEDSAAPAVLSSEEARRGAHFFVALCSSRPLGPIEPLLYLPSAANMLREREINIHRLEQRLAEKEAYLLALQADYGRKIEWAVSLERDVEKTRADFLSLQEDHASKIAWAVSLERDVEKTRADFLSLQEDHASKIAWAVSLERDVEKNARRLSVASGGPRQQDCLGREPGA